MESSVDAPVPRLVVPIVADHEQHHAQDKPSSEHQHGDPIMDFLQSLMALFHGGASIRESDTSSGHETVEASCTTTPRESLEDRPLSSPPTSPNSVQTGLGVTSKFQHSAANKTTTTTNTSTIATSYNSVSSKMQQHFHALEYTQEDVAELMANDHEFHRLQRSLRKKGAVTNELLKQFLPYVIRQHQRHSQTTAAGKQMEQQHQPR